MATATIFFRKHHALVIALALFIAFFSPVAKAKDSFKVCWSIYAGWMPWGYAESHGIIAKWAKKYHINIDVEQINDYIESINQYTAGNFDGCTMTNMDTMTIPAASGVDSTALVVGDYSNGNDGIVLRGATDLKAIKGRAVHLVQFSVSHYLLARALDSIGLGERDISTINTADADMVAVASDPGTQAVVTWNPQLSVIAAMPDYHVVYDSSKIPGEILDLMVVNSETLKANPNFGKALVGAWYETMGIMKTQSAEGRSALRAMATAAGTDLAGYLKQLDALYLFSTPQEAIDFVRSQKLLETMRQVAEFSFQHGLLGEGAPDAGTVGIETPAGVYGNPRHIKLRFDPSFAVDDQSANP
jgi:NitT/TauT family transport system substrate-binding protein